MTKTMRFDEQVNYWAHMLDESLGAESSVPQYTGKTDGYKWICCMESNIEESQFLKTFDNEASAVRVGVAEIMDNDAWDTNWREADGEAFFKNPAEAAAFFRKAKCIRCTDGTSFDHVLSVKRIRASEMPKLLELVYAHEDSYDVPIEFDGSNVSVDSMYGFDEWDKILDMMA